MSKKGTRVRQRRQQAVSVAAIYGAFMLATLVFRQQSMLLGTLHLVFAFWFGYLYHDRDILGFLLYGISSGAVVLGLLIGGPLFGALWFGGAILTLFGLLNTVNRSKTRKIL